MNFSDLKSVFSYLFIERFESVPENHAEVSRDSSEIDHIFWVLFIPEMLSVFLYLSVPAKKNVKLARAQLEPPDFFPYVMH